MWWHREALRRATRSQRRSPGARPQLVALPAPRAAFALRTAQHTASAELRLAAVVADAAARVVDDDRRAPRRLPARRAAALPGEPHLAALRVVLVGAVRAIPATPPSGQHLAHAAADRHVQRLVRGALASAGSDEPSEAAAPSSFTHHRASSSAGGRPPMRAWPLSLRLAAACARGRAASEIHEAVEHARALDEDAAQRRSRAPAGCRVSGGTATDSPPADSLGRRTDQKYNPACGGQVPGPLFTLSNAGRRRACSPAARGGALRASPSRSVRPCLTAITASPGIGTGRASAHSSSRKIAGADAYWPSASMRGGDTRHRPSGDLRATNRRGFLCAPPWAECVIAPAIKKINFRPLGVH